MTTKCLQYPGWDLRAERGHRGKQEIQVKYGHQSEIMYQYSFINYGKYTILM